MIALFLCLVAAHPIVDDSADPPAPGSPDLTAQALMYASSSSSSPIYYERMGMSTVETIEAALAADSGPFNSHQLVVETRAAIEMIEEIFADSDIPLPTREFVNLYMRPVLRQLDRLLDVLDE